MKNYLVKYRPFKGSKEDEMEIMAETDWAAEQSLKKSFPNGDVFSVTEMVEHIAEVIYVDFKARKVLKRIAA